MKVTKELFGFSKEEAEKILKDLKRYDYGIVERVKREIKKEPPPKLHSLTSLQREANKLYGFSAKRTLAIAQKLYEERKVISYPRTDSQHLAESNKPLVVQILKSLGREDLIPQVPKVGKRVFDDSKLTDHHAIIPLKPPPPNLTPEEKKIYELIKRRFLGVFYPPYRYEVLKIFTKVGDRYLFYTFLKRDLELGWKVLYSKSLETVQFPDLKEGDRVKKVDQKMEKRTTSPPPRYTEGMLLKKMEQLGLGTPATRAQIIETLKERGYVTKKGKVLVPTEKGLELIKNLSDSPVSSPEMTARWERALENIYLKKVGYKGYQHFLEKVKEFTAKEIERLKAKTFEVSQNFKSSRRGVRKRSSRKRKG